MVTLGEIMTTGISTLSPDATLLELHELMLEKHIRHVPIVSDGELQGIVSHRDLLSATPVTSDQRNTVYTETKVKDIMQTGVATVSPSTNLRVAAHTLERHKIGCLPVVEDGKLCGIVTDSDFIAIAINLLEQFEYAEDTE